MNTEDSEEVHDGEPENTRSTKKGWSRLYITVEPIKLCIGFTNNFTSGVTIDMLQKNICYQKYNLSGDQCWSNMTADIKSGVEGATADMNMFNQVLQGFFPLLLVLFIGPWSDRNGRKPFVILPLLGFSLYYLSWAVLAYFPYWSVYFLLIPSVLVGTTGSMIALYNCTWSYTCDNFAPDERAFRFSLNISCTVIGGLLGNALAGQAMSLGGEYGFQVVFFTSFGVTLIALLYTVFALEETIVRTPGAPRSKLIDFGNIKSAFIVFLVRPEKGILLSLLILIVILCEIPLNAGDDGILYMVGKSHYSWNLNTYNLIVAISSIASAVSPVLLVWLLMDVLKMSNITVLVGSMTLFVLTEILKALSVNQAMFWSAVIATKIGGVIGPAIDTELSCTVSEQDVGKAFTMISIGDALSPVISIPVYTAIYRIFLPNHTPYVFFSSAVLATVGLMASVGIFFRKESFAHTRLPDTSGEF